jgi:peptide/nickel transport system ATP-binding protein
VSIGVCPTLDVELWPAGPGRRAACVHVRDRLPTAEAAAP